MAIIAAGLAAACAPIAVTTYTERGVDVTAYRTFAWEPASADVPGDPRLDNNEIFHDYLRGAIDRQLVSRGYEPTTLQPDVYVHYHASARQKVHVDDSQRTTGPCVGCSVEIYDEGTLVVDLTNARTGALVWRGVAESGLPDTVNRQPDMEKTIERVVDRVFARLPRRS
jgi:hypothetical protein